MKKLIILALCLFSFVIQSCDDDENKIAVQKVTISEKTVEINPGQKHQLNATINPDEATDKTLVWTSSKTDISSVSTTGMLTAIKVGTTIVTAEACNGVKSTCTVSVVEKIIDVTGVTLDKGNLAIEEEQTQQLTVSVLPENATDKSVAWSSSDDAIATVSASGLVTAVKEGSAVITVTSSNNKTAKCNVVVSKKVIEVATVTLNKTELTLEEGKKETLVATVKPDDATDKTVTWESADDAIATVSATGEVTAVKAGTVAITVKANNNVSAVCNVTVKKPVIELTNIQLNKANVTLKDNETVQLEVTFTPFNATDKTVTWESSDAAVATVSATGLVTAIKEGEVVITVKSTNNLTATCNVKVANEPSFVDMLETTSYIFDLGVVSSDWNRALYLCTNLTEGAVTDGDGFMFYDSWGYTFFFVPATITKLADNKIKIEKTGEIILNGEYQSTADTYTEDAILKGMIDKLTGSQGLIIEIIKSPGSRDKISITTVDGNEKLGPFGDQDKSNLL